MADDKKDDDDGTRAGAMRPPRIPVPASGATPPARPGGGENTGVGGAPPPALPKRPEPTAPVGAAETPAAAEPARETTGSKPPAPPKLPEMVEEGTQIYVRPTVTLTRLGPPGHSGVIPLESGPYRLGRSSQCDILLYAPESSRIHAHLRRDARGWLIEPEPGKQVIVNGESVNAAVALGQKARLRLGGDELLFLDESRPALASPPATVAEAPQGRFGTRTWLIVAAAVLATAALLRFVLSP